MPHLPDVSDGRATLPSWSLADSTESREIGCLAISVAVRIATRCEKISRRRRWRWRRSSEFARIGSRPTAVERLLTLADGGRDGLRAGRQLERFTSPVTPLGGGSGTRPANTPDPLLEIRRHSLPSVRGRRPVRCGHDGPAAPAEEFPLPFVGQPLEEPRIAHAPIVILTADVGCPQWRNLSMSDPAARLLRLLGLLQRRPRWSGAELAESLGVDPRSI
jgi:hypothetical protein